MCLLYIKQWDNGWYQNQTGSRRGGLFLGCGVLRFLTKEGRRRDGAVAAGNHDADARLHEGHREIDDLRTFLVDGEGADGHVSSSVEDLSGEDKQRKKDTVSST